LKKYTVELSAIFVHLRDWSKPPETNSIPHKRADWIRVLVTKRVQPPIVRDSALIDVGLAFELAPGNTLGASYAGQFANDLQDNAVQGRLGWSF